MNATFRGALKFGSIFVLAASLAACGPDDAATEADPMAWLDGAGPMDWPLDDQYRDGPPFAADAIGPLPAVAPMTAQPRGSYGYAPAYDYYDPGEPDYYDPAPPDGSYAWLAIAATLADVFANSPPDYYFDYHGVQPWVWRTHDRYYRYAEPVGSGYRYYYYEPRAVRPFLVRDPYYSYGYRGDRLVVIYDNHGRVLDGRKAWRQRRAAVHYFDRGRKLHHAAHRRPHHGVSAPRWVAHRSTIERDGRIWDRAREQRVAWRKWEDRREHAIDRRWKQESTTRDKAARRFERWHKADYRDPAPRLYEDRRGQTVLRTVSERRQAAALRDGPTRRQSALWAERYREPKLEDRSVRSSRQAVAVRQARDTAFQQQERRGFRTEREQAKSRQLLLDGRQPQQHQLNPSRHDEREAQARRGDRSQRLAGLRQQREARIERQRSQRQAQFQRERQQQQAWAARQQQAQREDRANRQREQRQAQAAQRQQAERQAQMQQRHAQQQAQREARATRQRDQRQAQAAQRQQAERQAQMQQRRAQQQAQREARATRQREQRQAQAAQRQQDERQARMQQQQAQAAQRRQAERQAQMQQQRAQRQQAKAQRQAQQQAAARQQQREQAQQQRAMRSDGNNGRNYNKGRRLAQQ